MAIRVDRTVTGLATTQARWPRRARAGQTRPHRPSRPHRPAFRTRLRHDKALLLLALPGIGILLLFQYVPLLGNVIAFENYEPFIGIVHSQWAGLSNFAIIFDGNPAFLSALRNTLIITVLQVVLVFPVPIGLALLLNSMLSQRLKRLVQSMLPPDYDSGSKAITWQATPSSFSFTAVKKAPKARLKVLLKVCDWLAAPFGSAEYLLKTYAVSGTDWVRKNGDLAQTSTGANEVPGLGVGYVAAPPYPLYYPDLASATTDVHTFMARSLPMSVGDPTTGLYSQTSATKGPGLTNQITDARHAIMQGQQPLSSWDEAVATWRSSGGDQMRAEFETALHHSA